MARGTWEDFTDKFGFSHGEQLEHRDFAARDALVRLLNKQPEMKTAGVRALAFDRPGMHNPCQILLAPEVAGKSDEELLESLGLGTPPELPEMEAELSELIAEAYDEITSEEND